MSVVKKAKYFVKGLKEKPQFMYTPQEDEQVASYISRNFGTISKVYHELYSPDIHLDILIIPPTDKSDFYKLVTMGMGAYKMNVPEVLKEYDLERAELVAFLPSDWNMDFNDKRYKWVISELKMIGRTAIFENGWVGFGHTFQNDEKGEVPLSKYTKYTSVLLINAITENYNEYYLDLKLPDKGQINFYQLYPLYKEELDYVKKNGVKKFSEIIPEDGLLPLINFDRPNYCKNLKNKNLIHEDYELEK